MPITNDYLDYVLDLLRDLNDITYKKMMGEVLLYKEGILFGGIYDNRFLIKITKSNEKYNLAKEVPYTGAKLMYMVDTDEAEVISSLVDNVLNDLNKKR